MAESGHAFDSSYVSTQWGSRETWGAGANAGSRNENMFVANTSLSELVWSPSRGLGIKCADWSLPNKNSLLWFPESVSMMFLSSESIKGKEIENNGTVNDDKLNSIQVESDPGCENRVSETLVRSPTGCESITPLCELGSRENIQRSYEMKAPVTQNVPVVGVDAYRDDQQTKKEMNMHSKSDAQRIINNYEVKCEGNEMFHDNTSTRAPNNERSANSSSNRLEEPVHDVTSVNPNIVDHVEGGDENIQPAGSADVFASEVLKMKPSDHLERLTSSGFLGIQYVQAASAFEEVCGNKHTYLEKQESTAENDVKSLRVEGKLSNGSAFLEVAKTEASQPEGVVKHSPEKKVLFNDPLNERGHSIEQRLVEEEVLSDQEDNQSNSKEQEKSHESVESSNSGKFRLRGRRARSFKHELVVGNKKIKTHQNETPGSASVFRQDSSFMNWISNIMKGLSKSNSDETPYLPVPTGPSQHEHGCHNSLVMSREKIPDDVGRSTSFHNVFHAMYCPKEKMQNQKKGSLYLNTDADDSKELSLTKKIPIVTCDDDHAHAASNEENSELHKYIDGGRPALTLLPSAKIRLLEEKICDLHNNASGSKINDVLISNSHFTNNLGSMEREGAIIHTPAKPDKLSSSVAKKGPLESLWISRFSPRPSTTISNSGHYLSGKVGTIEGPTDYNRLLTPLAQNIVVSSKDKNNLEDGHEPLNLCRGNAGSKTIQDNTLSPTGSITTKSQADQKFKSKLSPIQPSQKFKNSEAMASVFARRLDAFRYIILAKDNVTPSVFCFYCGRRGHTLRDCSEVTETELKDLLKNVNVCNGVEETTCFCIFCFQFNHWAVACPNSSSRKETSEDGIDPFIPGEDTERMKDKPQDQGPQRENLNTEIMVCTQKINSTMIVKGRFSDLKLVKTGLLGESHHKGLSEKGSAPEFLLNETNTDSTSLGHVLKENQVIPFANKLIPTLPKETFEIVRKLCLSRADILKWMKSQNTHFRLEGFFLRLRLGKWQGLGGTGYQVACITGASQEGSFGNCKRQISVEIGGLHCSIDCRHVSNHDFNEDEFRAWWNANMRVVGKLPSLEELSKKLEEREKYGL